MAAITLKIHHRESARPDGLCPRCFNPSLKTYTYTRLDLEGLTPTGERDACTDCNIWVGPVRELKETSK